jgi:regulator of sigma E protease
MFTLLTNALALVFVLGVLIFVHEFGHFATAKFFGIRVEVFALGFGPRLFGFRRGDTDYRVCALPLGGYVKMTGENPDEELTGADDEFLSRPKWQRFLVLFNGPAMNVILSFLLLTMVFMRGVAIEAWILDPVEIGLIAPDSPAAVAELQRDDRVLAVDGVSVDTWGEFDLRVLISGGQRIELTVDRDGTLQQIFATPERVGPNSQGYLGAFVGFDPVVFEITPDTPAEQAGLQPGDRFVAVDNVPVNVWFEVTSVVRERPGEPTDFVIEREGRRIELNITPAARTTQQGDAYGALGVRRADPPRVLQSYGLVGAMGHSAGEIRRQTLLVGEILGRLFTGRMSVRTLSGPIEIANYSGAAARTGDPFMLFFFMGVVSLQLGLLNLLPIPVLDGGHIAVLAFEGITRHDLSLKVKERMMTVGVVLLVTLMLVVITFDMLKTLGR